MAKFNRSQRAALHRFCLLAAVICTVPMYLWVPLTGRIPIAAATLATGLLAYGGTRWICTKAYNAL